ARQRTARTGSELRDRDGQRRPSGRGDRGRHTMAGWSRRVTSLRGHHWETPGQAREVRRPRARGPGTGRRSLLAAGPGATGAAGAAGLATAAAGVGVLGAVLRRARLGVLPVVRRGPL